MLTKGLLDTKAIVSNKVNERKGIGCKKKESRLGLRYE